MAVQETTYDERDAVSLAEAATERFDTIVIGGGQAGLAMGYHLKKQGRPFVVLDANERIGGSWRTRTWHSLRLFTPARVDGLPGWPFPAPAWSYPTSIELADYLEAYAQRFELPVRSGVTVDRLAKAGDCYIVDAGDRRFQADHVVVATGFYGKPTVPDFAFELDPGHRADALQRIPRTVPAARGRGPPRRRRQLGSRHRDGSEPKSPHMAVRA
jgi:cation diffusion facilitator CzcD-associated flavoprotein CzcO